MDKKTSSEWMAISKEKLAMYKELNQLISDRQDSDIHKRLKAHAELGTEKDRQRLAEYENSISSAKTEASKAKALWEIAGKYLSVVSDYETIPAWKELITDLQNRLAEEKKLFSEVDKAADNFALVVRKLLDSRVECWQDLQQKLKNSRIDFSIPRYSWQAAFLATISSHENALRKHEMSAHGIMMPKPMTESGIESQTVEAVEAILVMLSAKIEKAEHDVQIFEEQ